MRMQEQSSKNLDKVMERLKLGPADALLVRQYLTGQVGDEVLGQLPRREFKNGFFQHIYEDRVALGRWVEEKPHRAERMLKCLWAMAKSTMAYVFPYGVLVNVGGKNLDVWMQEVLGPAEAAAIKAENLSAWYHTYDQNMEDFHTFVRTHPQVAEGAYTLGGTTTDNMRVFLAGLLLASGGELSDRKPYVERILAANIHSLTNSMYKLTAQERTLLEDYLRSGDPRKPLPLLSSQKQPKTASQALATRVVSDELAALLGAASFAAAADSDAALCALRMYLTWNTNQTLYGIFTTIDPDYLRRMFRLLVEETPSGKATILLFLAMRTNERSEHHRRWALLCKEGLKDAYDQADFEQRTQLQSLLPIECKALGRDGKEDIITFLVHHADAGQQEIEAFLRGTGSLKNTQAALANAKGQCFYMEKAVERVRSFRQSGGWDDFVCRATLVATLVYKSYSCRIVVFNGYEFAENELTAMCEAMLQKELPLGRMLDVLGALREDLFRDEDKKVVLRHAIDLTRKPGQLPALQDAVTNGTVFTRQMAVLGLDELGDKTVLKACADSSKQVRESVMEVLPRHPEWVEDYAALLGSKKAAERLMGVELLAKFGRKELLEALLAMEKNAKVLDALRAKIGTEMQETASTSDLAAKILKGNKARKLAWLTEKPLPLLHWEDGSEVGEDIRNALLLSYSELGRIGRSDTARELAQRISKNDLSQLAEAVFEHWMADNAPAKQKWVLAFAAVFGGGSMTSKLTHAINDWPNHARGAIACDAVFALALSDDPAALVTVDAISRKFKFRQVKVAAGQALENAAQELGITAEELADRIVPTLGFGADGRRVFDYGKRSFTVRLLPTLELEITNDAGKTVKNLPAPGKTDGEMAASAYEAFKAMKKQIKTTVTAQRARLEAALSVSRCWESARWRELFVVNPIMHQFAMSLIWGVYENGTLTDTFRYMEDGSFNTVDEDEYVLPETGLIGLVHPVELDEETLEGWKQQLEDYEITQIIDQLSRPVYTLGDTDPQMHTLETFGGKVLNGLSLSGKLLGLGWYRGSVVDGGFFYQYYREDPALNLAVELRFSGSPVGDENEDVTVFDAVFYKPGTVQRGSYTYDTIKPENTYALGDIPKRYYSEVIHQLTKATASSTETDPDWKDMEGA